MEKYIVEIAFFLIFLFAIYKQVKFYKLIYTRYPETVVKKTWGTIILFLECLIFLFLLLAEITPWSMVFSGQVLYYFKRNLLIIIFAVGIIFAYIASQYGLKICRAALMCEQNMGEIDKFYFNFWKRLEEVATTLQIEIKWVIIIEIILLGLLIFSY